MTMIAARFPKWLTKKRVCGKSLANDELRAMTFPKERQAELLD